MLFRSRPEEEYSTHPVCSLADFFLPLETPDHLNGEKGSLDPWFFFHLPSSESGRGGVWEMARAPENQSWARLQAVHLFQG